MRHNKGLFSFEMLLYSMPTYHHDDSVSRIVPQDILANRHLKEQPSQCEHQSPFFPRNETICQGFVKIACDMASPERSDSSNGEQERSPVTFRKRVIPSTLVVLPAHSENSGKVTGKTGKIGGVAKCVTASMKCTSG
jgi:hypothetical protein